MDIGLEIKILRERAKMSSKELAEKIGLSQSQMSRLEKGQRKVDAELLNKIAEVLEVSPSYFFPDSPARSLPPHAVNLEDIDLELDEVNADIGKRIRKERRRRHLTAEEFGQKIDKNKPYVHALEEGKIDLNNPDLVQKICKVLKVDSSEFFSAQQKTINHLKKNVIRLSQALSDSHRGTLEYQSDFGDVETRDAIPIVGSLAEGFPREFSPEGMPLGDISDYVFAPGINDSNAFALFVMDDSMERESDPSFHEGDLGIFSPQAEVLSRDFIFVRIKGESPLFRQVYFDTGGQIRLQPLNLNYAPVICSKGDILTWWKLVAIIHRF